MPSPALFAGSDLEFVDVLCHKLSTRLEAQTDRSFDCTPVEVERLDYRPAGEGAVHLSFRVDVSDGSEARTGCLLLPYKEAVTLGSHLLMLNERAVRANRRLEEPDETMKDALRELNHVVAGAIDAVLCLVTYGRLRASSGGPQGVRAGVRPAFAYAEGDPLLVASARARIGDYPPFELLLMLPPPEAVIVERSGGAQDYARSAG